MYRYIILIWNSHEPQRSEAARALNRRLQSDDLGWKCVVDRAGSGLAVYHAGMRIQGNDAQSLGDSGGAVLGTLFRSGPTDAGPPTKATLSVADCEEVAASVGRSLIERYWGRYIAVIRSAAADSVRIIRDPSGGLPCFHISINGVHVVFSDIEDILRIATVSLTVNWVFVGAVVAYTMLQSRETGLNEVAEIPAGECIDIQGDTVNHLTLWDPLAIARSDLIESEHEAVRAMREATRACVHAWASCYGGIVHRLSGGLDSAIVLSCLQDAPSKPAVTCLNYYSEGSEEDERRFARLAAQRANCELIESGREVRAVQLSKVLDVSRSPRPWFYLYSVENTHSERQLASEKGATALFGGLAGDAIFYQSRAELAARDYVRLRGLRPSLLGVALDAARVERITVWSILRRSAVSRLIREPFDPFAETRRFRTAIASELENSETLTRRFEHPWLFNRTGVPDGKLWHVLMMSALPPYYDPLGEPDDPESVYPLISQPLLEVCLRIPTYVLIAGGWDRSIARKAFAQDVPREIIKRRDKGASTDHTRKLFDANVGFIREVLLDGLLIQRGLLDRKNLEAALSPQRTLVENAFSQILLQYLSIEVWLRRWSELRQSVAA